MKKSFNKAVSILLVIIMVFSCVPAAMAASFSGSWYTTYPDKITWSYIDGELSYSGKGAIKGPDLLINTDVYDVVTVELWNGITSIPRYAFDKFDTLVTVKFWTDTVTDIGASAFSECTSLKTINLPSVLTAIDDYVFYCCTSLKSVKIPSSVTMIGDFAFAGSGISYVSIPASVKVIEERAFESCYSLYDISVDGNNPYYSADGLALFDKEKTRLIKYAPGATKEKYIVPDTVEVIESYAFQSLESLKEIVLPMSATTIENYAFNALPLEKITIPYNVTSIGSDAFKYKSKVTIYGYSDSYVEEYANENGMAFVSLCTHNYTETITENATCVATGMKTLSCSDCGYEFTETIPVSETHSFTDYLSDNNATCDEDGTKTAKCDNCEATDTITDEDSATGHSFTKYVSDNNATCIENGTKTAKCDNCEVTETITDEGSKTGHNYELEDVYKPNCNTDGYGIYICTNCEDSYYDYDNYKATSHKDENGDGICDECTEDVDEESKNEKCSCLCHSSGVMKIIYKIIRFFWKIFKINKTCSCGIAHY
ncbi:MAG: leucine-rich repeat domain-containing protein [Clostridia bacterium]|nr:leucine-rich repeat domain-containing protein [Clostridia bacterium]